jgi:hypothetical protein
MSDSTVYAAPDSNFTVPDPSTALANEGRPRRTAIRAVLVWNIIPALVLTVMAISTASGDSNADGWEGLILGILIVLGGGALVVSTSLGAAVAAILIGRRARNAATHPSDAQLTRAKAILIGSGSAIGGWLLGFLAVAAFLALTQLMALMA